MPRLEVLELEGLEVLMLKWLKLLGICRCASLLGKWVIWSGTVRCVPCWDKAFEHGGLEAVPS